MEIPREIGGKVAKNPTRDYMLAEPPPADQPSGTMEEETKILAVAPMMDWTDRHCRFFHRLLAPATRLYTEMVVAEAVIRGDRARLLSHDASERPLALQLGGADPAMLAEAARIGAEFGHDEINLNVGCPSDRVQSGTFGACLMREPARVAACVAAMKRAVGLPVTVKCRLGVDEQDIETALDELADAVFAEGTDALWVHARKAWLDGLSPKENRDVPPLDYGRVYRLKQRLPDRFIGINGGIVRPADAADHARRVDGVMLGRAAYREPGSLPAFEAAVLGRPTHEPDWAAIAETMKDYAARHIAAGGRLSHVTRHMVGLYHGRPGARQYRQILSTEATRPEAGPAVIDRAFAAVLGQPASRAA